ncbi:MAG: hypothetical protein AAGE93_19755 [Bacteroidota bacterium]
MQSNQHSNLTIEPTLQPVRPESQATLLMKAVFSTKNSIKTHFH